MNANDDFDDLARRKLNERRFEPQEQDWLAVQGLISAERRPDRRRGILLLLTLLALIGGAGAWIISSRATVDKEVKRGLPIEDGNRAADVSTAVSGTINDPVTPPRVVSATRPADRAHAPDAMQGTTPSEDKSIDRKRVSRTEQSPASTLPMQRNDVPSRAEHDELPKAVAAPVHPVKPGLRDHIASEENIGPLITAPSSGTHMDDPSVEGTGSNAPSGPVAPSPTDSTSARTTVANIMEPAPSVEYYSTADPITSTKVVDTTASSTAANLESKDTLLPTSATHRHWEFTAMGGALLSGSSYSGGNSDHWRDGSVGRWAPSFGAEAMHMGSNFGIGTGVHHVTYSENLDVQAQRTTTTITRDSNYFQAVDTTLIVVTGTTQVGGQTYYITQPLHTTVQVLINGTSTSLSTREVLRAVRAANRVSYWEIPLLLDGHLEKGAWSVGVRGGPTLGLLSGRRGVLPNEGFDGYLSNDERSFKSLAFGATGRAYIRYRFADNWMLGVEPTWRTQFGNALGGGDIQRYNSGWGGFISLTYRLR